MRHFKKIDWSISLSVLFACVLTVIAACVESSGPLGAPSVVEAPTVSSVQITLAQSALAPGQTTQATAIAKSADGKVVAGHVDFSSQNPSIATVSSNGLVTALTAGICMIQATVASRAASATVTVKSLLSPVAVVAVALDSTSLAIGHSAKASATAKDSTGNLITGQTVTWASLSPAVATVASTGTVTAVAAGSATIQGTVSGKAGSASLTVIKVPASPVSVVAVQVDSTTLLVGHVAHASATAKDAMGNPIPGQVVTWASLTPGISSVSSLGAVTAVAAGPAIIQASVSGITGLDTLVVVVPPNLASNNFNNGTLTGSLGVFQFLYTPGQFDIVDDPTGSGRGKVGQFFYLPIASNISDDEVINPSTANIPAFRYGYTLWFKGDVYFPSANSSGQNQNSNIRKFIDFKGNGGVRMILYRQRDDVQGYGTKSNNPADSHSEVRMNIDWQVNGVNTNHMSARCGIVLNDDTWYTVEVMMTTNSADGVSDGVVEIYMNGAVTPTFRQATGLGWISESNPTSNFNFLMIGSQLSAWGSLPAQLFSEYRYWDNVAFSTTRIGR